MRSIFHPRVEIGDRVLILHAGLMLNGFVVEKDQGDCVIAVGDSTQEGGMTIADTFEIRHSRLSPLGIGRWAYLDASSDVYERAE